MTKLKFTFKNDILFKMVFVKYPDLLKRLVAKMLGIKFESIEQFEITNPEMPPDIIGNKFCRLDINMIVDGQRVDLEVQVADEGDYPGRSLYYWAREYSNTLGEGMEYETLPRTIIISILAFKLFDCWEYYSDFQVMEVTRHTLLTNKLRMLYFELPKLPKNLNADDELKLWLMLFNAETEEELEKIEGLGGKVMKQAIGAYRHVSATDEFKEIERMRSDARHNEASALGHARREAEKAEREKWQKIIAKKDADKDAALAENEDLRKQILKLQERLNKDK